MATNIKTAASAARNIARKFQALGMLADALDELGDLEARADSARHNLDDATDHLTQISQEINHAVAARQAAEVQKDRAERERDEYMAARDAEGGRVIEEAREEAARIVEEAKDAARKVGAEGVKEALALSRRVDELNNDVRGLEKLKGELEAELDAIRARLGG